MLVLIFVHFVNLITKGMNSHIWMMLAKDFVKGTGVPHFIYFLTCFARVMSKILGHSRGSQMVESRQEDGYTALHIAASNNSLMVAKVLIEQVRVSTQLCRQTDVRVQVCMYWYSYHYSFSRERIQAWKDFEYPHELGRVVHHVHGYKCVHAIPVFNFLFRG